MANSRNRKTLPQSTPGISLEISWMGSLFLKTRKRPFRRYFPSLLYSPLCALGLTRITLLCLVMAPPWPHMPLLSAGISLPAHAPVRTATAVPGTTLTLTLNEDGTVTTKHGISGIRFTCSTAGTIL